MYILTHTHTRTNTHKPDGIFFLSLSRRVFLPANGIIFFIFHLLSVFHQIFRTVSIRSRNKIPALSEHCDSRTTAHAPNVPTPDKYVEFFSPPIRFTGARHLCTRTYMIQIFPVFITRPRHSDPVTY